MPMRSFATFRYNFRASGSQLEGPIKFAIGQTTLGMVCIGRSQRGICSIFLGEDAQALRDQLGKAFPKIESHADQHLLQHDLHQIMAFIDKGAPEDVINLDIGGTAFEQKVWQALCSISTGQTRSYSEVARQLGAPAAARAVASACAANVLAIAIPCHRVIRSDGSVSGYRWGIERKRLLLAKESAAQAAGCEPQRVTAAA